ncbi:hypothetical protein CASFOL_032990 [Castilleja foliolosa]|uniref:Ribosomal protein L34Ae n=1 Tax=Castilleja foliolosa TaxID=1961234 RepID=A0ABD3C4E1_9LAMI
MLKLDGSVLLLNKNDKKIVFLESETELPPLEKDNAVEFRDCSEEKTEELYLKFKFPTYEEFSKIPGININKVDTFNAELAPSSKIEFKSREKSVLFDADVHDQEDEDVKCEAIMEFTENPEKETQIVPKKKEFIDDECQFSSDKNSVIIDSDSEVEADPHGDGFLSDGDFGVESDMDSEPEKTESELSGFEDNHASSDDFSDEDSDIMEEVKRLDDQNPNGEKIDFLSDNDFIVNSDDEFETVYEKGGDDIEKPMSKGSYEDENELESLWEHQELIEQLQIELKKVRATGLPTILEESESPKLMDDLKPWKIDEFQRGDCLNELHKFYKSYRERMRKFDIINYQKMYAMGFLQLKDPRNSISTQKTLLPTLKSLVSHDIWLFKNKIHVTDPTKKLIQELQGDLEAVYVAQMCLSWEFLHFQYDKALSLWDSDPRSIRRYNEVAGEFQQFQVLIQRFVENEPFQGPRVQNYVNTRCTIRNLLQVPVIREDKLKAKAKTSDEYVISSDVLVEIVEELIRVFWRFVRADKDCTINGHKKPDSDQDVELLIEIKKNLQKKERKLKDILRSENCVLRKFRKCREDDSDDQVLYFFSQVDMKLVGRVLNMSKITRDQLIWCRDKLDRISFVNRRIHVEPAFLLFPC